MDLFNFSRYLKNDGEDIIIRYGDKAVLLPLSEMANHTRGELKAAPVDRVIFWNGYPVIELGPLTYDQEEAFFSVFDSLPSPRRFRVIPAKMPEYIRMWNEAKLIENQLKSRPYKLQ